MTSRDQKILARMMVYYRAVGCAHFSGAETSIILHVMEHAWFRPVMVYGQKEERVVSVRPTRHAALAGYDQATISRALANLRDGNVLLDREGGFVPNPDWKSWIDNVTGRAAIKTACYDFVEFGMDESQGLHDCDLTEVHAEPHGTDVVDHAEPHGTDVVDHAEPHGNMISPCEESSQVQHSNGHTSSLATSHHSETSNHVGALYRTRPPVSEVYAESSEGSQHSPIAELHSPNHTHSSLNGLAKPIDARAASEATSKCVCVCDDGCNQSPSITDRPDATAVSYTMAGELPGPFDLDATQWKTFVDLTNRYFPMKEFASKLSLHRRQFPTVYFVKVVKRAILTKQRLGSAGWMLAVMRAWAMNPDGPDAGPEDDYDDRMNMFANPVIPMTRTIMDIKPGEPEPARFPDEVNQRFMDIMNARLADLHKQGII